MIYCITSRVNDGEFLVITQGDPCAPYCFFDLEEAKESFLPYYHILSKTPKTEALYRNTLLKLIRIDPVIVGLPVGINEVLPLLNRHQKSTLNYTCEVPILLLPHLITEMNAGFIEKYQKLDIVKDIESINCVNADGMLEVSYFTKSHIWKGEQPRNRNLSEEEISEILRSKGML